MAIAEPDHGLEERQKRFADYWSEPEIVGLRCEGDWLQVRCAAKNWPKQKDLPQRPGWLPALSSGVRGPLP